MRYNLSGEEMINKPTTPEIENILSKIHTIFDNLGFKKININKIQNYVYKNLYCIPQYGWAGCDGFFIEYAPSYEEAEKNWHCDGCCFPLELGEEIILDEIRAELLREIMKEAETA